MIDIPISNGIPYIWNPLDWLELRTKHRIVGSLDGAILENDRRIFRLPFKLTTIETQFLIEHDIARAIEYILPKDLATVKDYENLTQERSQKHIEIFRSRKIATLETMADKIIERKRKCARRSNVILDRETVIQQEMARNTLPFKIVQIDYKDPWIQEKNFSLYNFPKPASNFQLLLLKVFEDFNMNRKYYLSSGMKFGGHFLAYPGDPSEYHAEFIILCIDEHKFLTKQTIQGLQRLATNVKKTLLIAKFDVDIFKPIYYKDDQAIQMLTN